MIDTESLNALNLYSNDISAEGAKLIAQMLANKSNLRTLGLSNNIIGHGGARELANTCLRHLNSLQTLALESNLIGNIGLNNIANALLHNTNLQDLFLYNNDIDDEILPDFSKMLANKPQLRVLGLEYNRIRSRGAVSVFEAVQKLPKFERFFISHNLLDHEIGPAVSELITNSKTLKEIRINCNNQMGDECGLEIARALLRTQTVKVCHLSDTKLSGKSAEMLAEVLRQSPSLKDLDISNNLIIMDDIELLANAFKESQIECLNIRGNIVSAEEIVAFEHLLMPVSTMTKRKFIF